MIIINALNPDHALRTALTTLASDFAYSDSRNGPVLRFKEPVVTSYTNPLDRISRCPHRDANPFLHFIESAWMLAGRRDVATVGRLAANMYNYSDDGSTLYGAYGHRWREYFGFDQLRTITQELRDNPTSRRCVLQMWDGHRELATALAGGRDVCCNTTIYFDSLNGRLNMTVSNRSNDMVWGAYGANVVHMSILHEYMARQTNLELGTYYQFSNNLHLYINEKTEKLATYTDGKLLVNPDLHATYTEDTAQALFPHAVDDEELVASIEYELGRLMSGDEVQSTKTLCPFTDILSVLVTAFNIYKSPRGASWADCWLQDSARVNTLQSPWVLRASEWLRARPSYKPVSA